MSESVPQVNRPPTREEFERDLDERSKQNIYGGATDLSPNILGMLMSPNISMAAQKLNPGINLLLGTLAGALTPGKRKPTNQELNDKSMTPDMKYLKKLQTEKAKTEALEALQNKKAY